MHEHVVHRHLERVGVDALAHRQVALRVEVDAQHAVAPLDERGGEVQRRRGLRDAALLVGEGDDLCLGCDHGSAPVRRLRADGASNVPLQRAYSHELSGILHSSSGGSPLDKRLVVVTGKGGVGKTTVAAALGLAAARRGKRVIVVRGRRPGAPRRALGPTGGTDERELAPGALRRVHGPGARRKEEWLRYQLRVGARSRALLGGSRMFQYLTAAAPGLTELVTIGKVWDLAQLEPRAGTGAVTTSRSWTRPPRATASRCCARRAPTRASRASGRSAASAERIDEFMRDPRHDGRARRGAPGGDAGERDDRPRARARTRARHGARRGPRERGASRSASRPEECRRLEAVTAAGSGGAGRDAARRSRSTAARVASTRRWGGSRRRPRRAGARRCRSCSSPSSDSRSSSACRAELERQL